MPGRLFLTAKGAALSAFAGQDVPDQPPRVNIQPGEEVLTLTPDGPRMMRWGLIPVGRKNARGRPVMETIINARSETVFDKSAFEGVGRAVVPANGWYEWTGETRRKTAWRLQPASGEVVGFAAIYDIWTAPGGREIPQVATVTCEPNAEVKEIHHRMGVILTRDHVPVWLGSDQDAAAALMQPLPNGSVTIETAEDVDLTRPDG
ncbi:MAG: SOS response-associated peptidase [Pseudomonadota bacterium]